MKKSAFLFLSLCLGLNSYASTEDILKEECAAMIKDADKVSFSSQMSLMKELMGSIFNPDKLSELKGFKLKIDPRNQSGQEYKGLGLRNIVIYMGSTQETEERISESDAKAKIKALNDDLTVDYKKIMKMMKAGSVEACIAKAKEIDFSIDSFLEKSQKGQALYYERQVANNKSTLEMISSSLNRLNMEWEFVDRATVQEISDILKSPDVGNIVFVTHASQTGSIIDSEFNELPERVFTNISPTVRSIAVYSCHEELVRKKYKIDEKLISQDSMYNERSLYTPVTITYLGTPDSAPMSGFHGFMDRLETDLIKTGQNIYASAEVVKSNETCSIEMMSSKVIDRPGVYSVSTEEFKVRSGGYMFSLNGKVIGVLKQGSRESRIDFPCSFLNIGSTNVIVNQDYKADLKSSAKGETFDVYLNRPGHEVEVIRGKQFFRDDKSYRSSKFTFDLKE